MENLFVLKWLWRHMGKKRHYFVFGLLLSAVTSAMLIINPILSQKLIDEVVTPRDTTLLLPLLGAMMAVQLIRLSLRHGMILCLEYSSQQFLDDTRKKLYEGIQNQDSRFFKKYRTGDLMTRVNNDLDMMRHFCAWISFNVVDSVVILLVTLLYLLTVNIPLTLCLAAIIPFIMLITRRYLKKVGPMYGLLREKLSNLNTVAQENIAGNRVVKAFASEKYENLRFDKSNREFRETNLKAVYAGVKFQPLIDLLSQSLTVTSLLVGGIFMIRGMISAGQMLAFSSLTWALSNPFKNLEIVLNDLQRFFASSRKVIELYYAKPSVTDNPSAGESGERAKGDVEFRDVSFSVGGSPILSHVSFHAEAGRTLGIMGTTGAGKTTLVNLITRLCDATGGEVLLDGRNVREYTLKFLRSSIGVATQEVFLFSDTVTANVCYGSGFSSRKEAARYLRIAEADGFVRELEQGYETLIGERGAGLSGGQKQRIALARALAVRPSVLILDDTTSAVDAETEKAIQEQLRHLDFPCTRLIVAQRTSALRDADQILVMDRGRIIEQGTHDQLLQRRGYYYSVWKLQNEMNLGAIHLGA